MGWDGSDCSTCHAEVRRRAVPLTLAILIAPPVVLEQVEQRGRGSAHFTGDRPARGLPGTCITTLPIGILQLRHILVIRVVLVICRTSGRVNIAAGAKALRCACAPPPLVGAVRQHWGCASAPAPESSMIGPSSSLAAILARPLRQGRGGCQLFWRRDASRCHKDLVPRTKINLLSKYN